MQTNHVGEKVCNLHIPVCYTDPKKVGTTINNIITCENGTLHINIRVGDAANIYDTLVN